MSAEEEMQQPGAPDRDEDARLELIEQRPAGLDSVIADATETPEIRATKVLSRRGEPTDADLQAIEADAELEGARAIADAQMGEEIDALEADNMVDPADPGNQRDASGVVVDEIAHERLEELTESGKDVGEIGVLPQAPGRDDTSAKLADNNPQDRRMPFGESEEDAVLPDATLQHDEEGV